MDKKPQVIVVGGGAAGLTAGIMAARNGAAVTILEQNEKPGRKICVTGNGRCKPGICQGHSVSVFAGRYFEIF